MKNNKKIVIISIVILAILVIGILSGLYFFTDTFLNDEKRFYKYVGQSLNVMDFFEDKGLKEYAEKQENQGINNNGEISIDISGSMVDDEESKSVVDEIKKYKIAFSGSTDKANKYSFQDINMKYDNQDVLAISYINQDDYYGVKFRGIIEKFITFENNNLKEFATKFGITDTSKIPDRIDLSSLKEKEIFTKEELKELKEKYLKVIKDNLTEDMFSKKDEGDTTVYTLSINEDQAKKITVAIIDAFENDELLINKIKTIYMEMGNVSEESANDLVEKIKKEAENVKKNMSDDADNGIQLENASEDESTFDISVYVSKGKTSKIEMGPSDDNEKIVLTMDENNLELIAQNGEEYIQLLKINKEKTNDMLSYKFTTTDMSTGANIELGVSYTGIEKMAEVKENYYLKLYIDSNSKGMLTGDNGILAEAKKASTDTKNLSEREQVSFAINEMATKYYEDKYQTGNEWEINETKIKEYLTKSKINATVTKNADGTYKIQTELGNVYTVDSNGKITNTEYAPTDEQIVSTDENQSLTATLNISNTKTFGDVNKQELNEQNMYLVNEQTPENLSSMFSQLGQKIVAKFIVNDKNIAELVESMTEKSEETGILSSADKAKDTLNNVNLSEQEKNAFNAKFTTYEGTNVSGSQVNALIQMAVISNQTEISNNSNKYVSITFPSTTGKQVEISVKNGKQEVSDSRVAMGKTYKVALGYKDGIVNTVTVTEN